MINYLKYEEVKEEQPGENLADIIPNIDENALDLLEKMLEVNPQNRITAAKALDHPFLVEFLDDE
jgi:serine/threonine protein kinase